MKFHFNANVEWCFVIGWCRGNCALFDVGIDAGFSETSLQKVPNISNPDETFNQKRSVPMRKVKIQGHPEKYSSHSKAKHVMNLSSVKVTKSSEVTRQKDHDPRS